MKLRGKFIILFVLGVFTVFIVQNFNIQVKGEENKKSIEEYVAIGDSLNSNKCDEFNLSYSKLIYQFFKAINPNMKYEDLSKANMSLIEIKELIEVDSSKIENADVVSLIIGENTILNIINNKDDIPDNILKEVEKFEIEFSELILSIKELAPQAEIYVNTIYNPFNEGEELYETFQNGLININNLIYNGEEQGLYKVIDMCSIFNSNDTYCLNYNLDKIEIILNNNGHALLASEVIKEYEAYVDFTVNNITEKSNELIGKTIPNSRILILSGNRLIANLEADKSGVFKTEISSLDKGSNIDILVYDKQLFSILYKSATIKVK